MFILIEMTPNEITTLIASNLKKELDTPFKKQLWERIKYWRSTLIKQSLDKVRQDAHFFRQTLYLPMEKVNELICIDGELECYVSRTQDEIPTPLRITDAGVLEYIGGIDGSSPFGYADSGTLRYLRAGKYSQLSLFPYYRYENNKIITTLPDLPKIRISGVFSDPEVAMQYKDCEKVNKKCDWWNEEVPMSGDIAQRIVQSILTVDYRQSETPENTQIEVNGPKP